MLSFFKFSAIALIVGLIVGVVGSTTISTADISDLRKIPASAFVAADSSLVLNIDCDPAEVIISGGFSQLPDGVQIVRSEPAFSTETWTLRFKNTTPEQQFVGGIAICATLSL